MGQLAIDQPKAAPVPAQVRQLRDRLKQEARRGTPETSWFEVSDEMRRLLVSLCTERPIDNAHMLKWSDLTDEEQIIIGSQARSFARLAAVAERLR